jgi:hypothetical protein
MRAKLLQKVAVHEAAQPMLEHFARVNRASTAQRRKQAAEPEVGIFFLYNGHVYVDGTPVSLGESFGNFKGHGAGHDSFWRTLQRVDIVPKDVEYDEVPRGRVGYDVKERKFYIFADACILKNERALDKVDSDFNLPSANTAPPRLDSHYKCPGCAKAKSKKQVQQEEDDWDF